MDERPKITAWMRTMCLATALLLTAYGGRAWAGDEETYRERLEFDPATGTWKELPAPIPGTDGGDLAIARGLLSRENYKAARKAFRQWFKTWPESTLRPEALFYAAETEVSAEDAQRRGGDLILAYEYLQELVLGWPGTELSERGLRKELIIAEMILFKGHKQKVWKGTLWLSATDEALQMLDRIIDDLARDTPIAEQALRLKADYHYQAGEFEEAELAYARLTRDFPRGRYHKFAMLRSGEAAFARFPGVEFDDADLLEAEVYLQDFSRRFPQDAEPYGVPQKLISIREKRAEKDYQVGRYYERVRQPTAAAYYYRQIVQLYPATTWAIAARERLVALGVMEPPASKTEPLEDAVSQAADD